MKSNLFAKLKYKADEFYHTDQIEAFFNWIEKKIGTTEFVCLNLPLQQEVIEVHTKKTKKYNDFNFIVCSPGKLNETLNNFGKNNCENWHLIFFSSGIEIWENGIRFTGRPHPVRFGLSDVEKSQMLRFARKEMTLFLNSKGRDENNFLLTTRRNEIVTLDVAIWVNSQLRGSIIIENKPLEAAIIQACQKSLRDVRMKPLEVRELEQAKIEITIMSDLRLPLSSEDKEQTYIDGSRGYHVSDGEKKAWYIPTVFNCIKLKKTQTFIKSLIEDKAKIFNYEESMPVQTYIVEGFIEKPNDFLRLEGSVAYCDVSNNFDINCLKKSGNHAADWLLQLQDTDGYIPLFVDPLSRSYGRMDWPRLACTVHALAAYGRAVQEKKYQEAAKKSFMYLMKYIFDVPVSSDTRIATLVYLGQASIIFDEKNFYCKIIGHIGENWDKVSYRPIVCATIASLFATDALWGKGVHTETAVSLAEKIFKDFRQVMGKVQLALYPELACTMRILHEVTSQPQYINRAEEIEEWLVSQQLRNGAFPASSGSTFYYTRGTGKVFEILANSPEQYKPVLHMVSRWLMRMQYTEENLYFADESFKKNSIGGLRHDLANTEAWIDSAAHYLLGISRLVRHKDIPY